MPLVWASRGELTVYDTVVLGGTVGKHEVKSSCIGTLVRAFGGGERKNDTPKPDRRHIARKDDEFPDASHLREERERDAATDPRAAMPTKNEEFA